MDEQMIKVLATGGAVVGTIALLKIVLDFLLKWKTSQHNHPDVRRELDQLQSDLDRRKHIEESIFNKLSPIESNLASISTSIASLKEDVHAIKRKVFNGSSS